MQPYTQITQAIALSAIVLMSTALNAQALSTDDIQRLQEAQRQSQLNAQAINPNVNQASSTQSDVPTWLPYTPITEASGRCFKIETVQWKGSEGFDWLVKQAAPVTKQCIGIANLKALQAHLGQALIQAGYITTRLLILEQDLSSGILKLELVPGIVTGHSEVGTTLGRLALPMISKQGKLLNQRDLDQAIENVRRLPSQDQFAIDVAPGKEPGQSILQVKSAQDPKRWRMNLSLDNSGAVSTGNHYQLGGTFSYDSPLGLYDALTLNVGSNSNFGVHDRHNASRAVQWSMPIGYASIQLGLNDSRYKQTVAGFAGPIAYTGRSAGIEGGVNYVFHRNAQQKNTLGLKVVRKMSRSYIDDTEVDVQFKDITGYEINYAHRNNLAASTLELGLTVKGNLTRYTNNPGVIIGQPDWGGRTLLFAGNVSWVKPLTWGDTGAHKGQFQTQFKWQNANTPVPNSDFFSIGGRYSVRGTDGLMSLSSDRGWLIRNDLSWTIPSTQTQIYLAYDFGKVSGSNVSNLIGTTLSGVALGYKGKFKNLNFDLTVGKSANTPAGFKTKTPTYYGQISYDL